MIIIDDTIPALIFDSLLAESRSLEKTRTIVVNPIQNEMILLDSHRETLKNVDEIIEAIGSFDLETPAEVDDRNTAEIKETAKHN